MQHDYKKPSIFWYRVTQLAAFFASKLFFNPKMKRNEIKGVKGPAVIIANHQAALDFMNIIGISREPFTFVISNSFYQVSSIKGIMDKIAVIPKQQFQTSIKDMHLMRGVIDAGHILVIYPAGLMCEDGLSTPIPIATYRFLQWLRADIYVAKTSGTYFCTPKWSKKRRRGRTYMDVYKLFDKEELVNMKPEEMRERTDEALLFDAYREQEELLVKYAGGDNIEGLENVLYICPHCKREFTMRVREKSVIHCTECGFAQRGDKYGFLHKVGDVGEEIRYVSDWSKMIFDGVLDSVNAGEEPKLSCKTKVCTIDTKKRKFVEIGEGEVSVDRHNITLTYTKDGEEFKLEVPTNQFPTMPFRPGEYIELQHGEEIFRCVLDDGRLAMKFINIVKAYHKVFECEHMHV